jgi:hypothetical protein
MNIPIIVTQWLLLMLMHWAFFYTVSSTPHTLDHQQPIHLILSQQQRPEGTYLLLSFLTSSAF